MSLRARTRSVTGSVSGIGLATKQPIESERYRVIGTEIHNAEVIADLRTREGRTALVEKVTTKSGGALAITQLRASMATVPATVAINHAAQPTEAVNPTMRIP
jgi:hypothetical protein